MSRRNGGSVSDVAVPEPDLPPSGAIEPGDHVQRRRLAAAAGTEQRHELALRDVGRWHPPPSSREALLVARRAAMPGRLAQARSPVFRRGNRQCRRSGRTGHQAERDQHDRIETAASVGAKPNSRNPRIATVNGRSPGRAMNSDRFTSSKLCTKAKIMPASVPAISGNVTWRSTAKGVAPRLAAAELQVAGHRGQADRDGAHGERQAITTWPTAAPEADQARGRSATGTAAARSR